MQAFRKFGATRAAQLATTWKKPVVMQTMNMSYTYRDKTYKDDEFKGPKDDDFYRDAEDIRQRKAMRDNFMRIQALPENNYEKFVLREMLLPRKPSEMSFRERWGLYDWRLALPVGSFLALPLFSMELIPINAYYFIIVHFLWNSWFCYVFWAPRLSPDLNEGVYLILKDVQGADDRRQAAMESKIESNDALVNWEGEVTKVLELADELTVAQVDVFNSMEGHAFRNAVASKLDALVSLEMAANQNIRHRMVTAVKSEVKTLFATNKTARENAMNQAIAILTAGQTGKMGTDVVGDAFSVAVKNYQEAYVSQAPGSDEIFANLEKDMAAIMTPVEFEVTGGNVFETNLIKI